MLMVTIFQPKRYYVVSAVAAALLDVKAARISSPTYPFLFLY
jgi:hypothetical protein